MIEHKATPGTPDDICEKCSQLYDGDCVAHNMPHSEEERSARLTGNYGMECDSTATKVRKHDGHGAKYHTPLNRYEIATPVRCEWCERVFYSYVEHPWASDGILCLRCFRFTKPIGIAYILKYSEPYERDEDSSDGVGDHFIAWTTGSYEFKAVDDEVAQRIVERVLAEYNVVFEHYLDGDGLTYKRKLVSLTRRVEVQ